LTARFGALYSAASLAGQPAEIPMNPRKFLGALLCASLASCVLDSGGGDIGANVKFVEGYVFVRDGEVYVIDKSDYAAAKPLTASGGNSAPAISGDGKTIVYVHTDPLTNATSLRKVSSGGLGDAELVPADAGRKVAQPAINRAGTKIVYLAVGAMASGLRVVNADGTGDAAVPGSVADASPSFLPDGQVVVLSGNALTHTEIVKVELTAGVRSSLISGLNGTLGERVAASPDGTRVAFELKTGTKFNVYAAELLLGASSAHQLSATGGNDRSPTFVTNDRIGFSSDYGSVASLYENDVTAGSPDSYALMASAVEQPAYGGNR
jgi:Tol biopolymer transport system component